MGGMVDWKMAGNDSNAVGAVSRIKIGSTRFGPVAGIRERLLSNGASDRLPVRLERTYAFETSCCMLFHA